MFPIRRSARRRFSSNALSPRWRRLLGVALLASLAQVGCGDPGGSEGDPTSGPAIDRVAAEDPANGRPEDPTDASRAQPHLDGASFSGDVRPGLAAVGLADFLDTHVGAKVHLDLVITGFEGETGPEPAYFWLRPLCDREEREADADGTRCRDSHVAILGPPELFTVDAESGTARLRGAFGIEVPKDPRPGLRAWTLVANPIRRSELAGGAGSSD